MGRMNYARWPALILIISLALTGCFRSAGEDLPPTQPGDTVLVGQNNTPVVDETEPLLPTAETDVEEPTAEDATEFPTPIPTLSPFPTLGGILPTVPPTLDGQGGPMVQQPPTRVTIQPTFTPPPTQVIAMQPSVTPPPVQVEQPTYTPLPTYTPQPTFTPLAPQVAVQPTFTRAAPVSGIGPTLTFTPVPYNPLVATASYTPYPPVAAEVQPQQQPVQPQVVTQAPVEAVPLGELPTFTLSPGGQGGPIIEETPPAVAQVATLTPTVPLFEEAVPPQGPTLTGGQMTATQIVYGATATAAFLMGTVLPPDAQPGQLGDPLQPDQQPFIDPGQLPPNVTLVTATPLGQPGMCGEHRIAIGETLSRIAVRYGITTQEIATANNLVNPDLIEAGKTLLIPCATAVVATPIAGQPAGTVPTTSGQVYTVQAGDNIYRISLKFGVDMGELVRVNGLNEVTMNTIYVGQQLVIPATAVIVGTPIPGTPLPGPTLTPYIIVVTPSTIG